MTPSGITSPFLSVDAEASKEVFKEDVGASFVAVLSFFKDEKTLCRVLTLCTSVDKLFFVVEMTSSWVEVLLLSSKEGSFKGS